MGISIRDQMQVTDVSAGKRYIGNIANPQLIGRGWDKALYQVLPLMVTMGTSGGRSEDQCGQDREGGRGAGCEDLAEANTKAQDVEKNAMTEISLAGKQALSKIKAEISSMIIAKSTAPAVKAATLDPEFVKQMLLTVAKNWSGADSSKNQLKALLPEAEQKAFEATFEAAAKELLAAGVEVGYSKEVRTGFKVGAKDGGYYISFSDQDFDALLKEYLRDKVYKMLYNA